MKVGVSVWFEDHTNYI